MDKQKKREQLVESLSEYISICQKELTGTNESISDDKCLIESKARYLIAKIESVKSTTELLNDISLANQENEKSVDLMTRIIEEKKLSIEQLNALWQARDLKTWSESISHYVVFAEKAVAMACPLIAYDILNEALTLWPKNIRLRQLFALAMMRIGISDKANETLYKLYDEGDRSEETLGMLGSTYKGFWRRQIDKSLKDHFAIQSIKYYGEAYQVSKGRWSGINYATMLLVSGKKDEAKCIAGEVKKNCLKEFEIMDNEDFDYYWVIATLGEATFILKELDESKKWYKKANSFGESKLGDIISTRKNLKMLFEYVGISIDIKQEFDKVFEIPKVIAFTGHMIDRKDSENIRFPKELEGYIAKEIYKKVEDIGNVIGFSSGASGADILFLEVLKKNNNKMNVILPCNIDDFRKYSVDYIEESRWGDRFLELLSITPEVTTISKHVSGLNDIPFDFTNKIIYGMARIKAEQMDTDLIPLAVWNNDSINCLGGTGSVIDYWKKYEKRIEIIDLKKALKHKLGISDLTNQVKDCDLEKVGDRRNSGQIMGLLFADTVNYSKLNDREMIKYGNILNVVIKKIVKKGKYEIIHSNAWGDAFFFVFEEVKQAGLFALDFVEEINLIDWKEESFSCHIQLRTALHAGAVYSCKNPVTDEKSYNGANVCRVARMESVTPPGQVFCSLEFAAYSSALHIEDYLCDYVGKIIMPKQFGEFPTYHVRRK